MDQSQRRYDPSRPILRPHGILVDSHHLSRNEVVNEIMNFARTKQCIIATSPPATGKTALLQLVQDRLHKAGASVERFSLNGYTTIKELKSNLEGLGIYPWGDLHENVKDLWLLFDDAHNWYGREYWPFWQFLIHGLSSTSYGRCFIIITATHDLSSLESPVHFSSLPHFRQRGLWISGVETEELFFTHIRRGQSVEKFVQFLKRMSKVDQDEYHVGVIVQGIKMLQEKPRLEVGDFVSLLTRCFRISENLSEEGHGKLLDAILCNHGSIVDEPLLTPYVIAGILAPAKMKFSCKAARCFYNKFCSPLRSNFHPDSIEEIATSKRSQEENPLIISLVESDEENEISDLRSNSTDRNEITPFMVTSISPNDSNGMRFQNSGGEGILPLGVASHSQTDLNENGQRENLLPNFNTNADKDIDSPGGDRIAASLILRTGKRLRNDRGQWSPNHRTPAEPLSTKRAIADEVQTQRKIPPLQPLLHAKVSQNQSKERSFSQARLPMELPQWKGATNGLVSSLDGTQNLSYKAMKKAYQESCLKANQNLHDPHAEDGPDVTNRAGLGELYHSLLVGTNSVRTNVGPGQSNFDHLKECLSASEIEQFEAPTNLNLNSTLLVYLEVTFFGKISEERRQELMELKIDNPNARSFQLGRALQAYCNTCETLKMKVCYENHHEVFSGYSLRSEPPYPYLIVVDILFEMEQYGGEKVRHFALFYPPSGVLFPTESYKYVQFGEAVRSNAEEKRVRDLKRNLTKYVHPEGVAKSGFYGQCWLLPMWYVYYIKPTNAEKVATKCTEPKTYSKNTSEVSSEHIVYMKKPPTPTDPITPTYTDPTIPRKDPPKAPTEQITSGEEPPKGAEPKTPDESNETNPQGSSIWAKPLWEQTLEL